MHTSVVYILKGFLKRNIAANEAQYDRVYSLAFGKKFHNFIFLNLQYKLLNAVVLFFVEHAKLDIEIKEINFE